MKIISRVIVSLRGEKESFLDGCLRKLHHYGLGWGGGGGRPRLGRGGEY